MLTPVILVLSEIPTFFCTLLDFFKFSSLKKYRINHRNYPSNEQLLIAFRQYRKIFAIIFCITSAIFLGMEVTGICPYNLGEFNQSYLSAFIELFFVSFCNDVFYYFLHRLVHTPGLYWIHKNHHAYRYDSFALVNHVLDPLEICLFIIPAAITPILLGTHIYLVWIYAITTNLNGTLGHSAYNFPFFKFAMVDPSDHDTHHTHPWKNFSTGFCFSIVDRIFNTYLHCQEKLNKDDDEGIILVWP